MNEVLSEKIGSYNWGVKLDEGNFSIPVYSAASLSQTLIPS
jgi:hypothetical protein